MWSIWLIVAGVCFVIEMMTVGFFVFWFGVGALLTMIISFFFPNNLVLQATIFVISSTLCIFCTKPLVKKLSKSDKKIATNAYSLIGKKGIVIDNSTIEKGCEIEIIEIDGVKAVVKPLAVTANLGNK